MRNKNYFFVNYSIGALNMELIRKYGMAQSFDLWEAYSHLKKYVGFNDVRFEQDEFNDRIENIREVLNISDI